MGKAMSNKAGSNKSRASVAHRFQKLSLQHRRIAAGSVQRLLQAPASTAMTITVIAVALMFPTLLSVVNINLSAELGDVPNSTTLTLFMDVTANDSEIQDVSEYLQTLDIPNSVEFISATQAMEEFAAGHSLGSLLTELPSNPLPAAYVITTDSSDIGALDALATELQSRPGVDLVQYDRVWIERLQAINALVSAFNLVLMLLVGAGLLAIVGNTIRLAVEHRRQEIMVIKLVGGSDAYIARPFLYTGLFLGLAGGATTGLLLTIVMLFLGSAAADLSTLYGGNWQLRGLGFTFFFVLAITGAAVGWIAALLASYRNIASINP